MEHEPEFPPAENAGVKGLLETFRNLAVGRPGELFCPNMATVSSAVASIPSPVVGPWLTSPQTPVTTFPNRELAVLLSVGSTPNTPMPLDPLLSPETPTPVLAVAAPSTPVLTPSPSIPRLLLLANTAVLAASTTRPNPTPDCVTVTSWLTVLPLKLALAPEIAPLALMLPVSVMLPVTVCFPVLTLPVKLALAPDTEPVALRLPFTISLPVTVGIV